MLARKSANRKSGSYGFHEGERISGTDARVRACKQKKLDHIIFLKASELVAPILGRERANRKILITLFS